MHLMAHSKAEEALATPTPSIYATMGVASGVPSRTAL